jgi:hypothetical protein
MRLPIVAESDSLRVPPDIDSCDGRININNNEYKVAVAVREIAFECKTPSWQPGDNLSGETIFRSAMMPFVVASPSFVPAFSRLASGRVVVSG